MDLGQVKHVENVVDTGQFSDVPETLNENAVVAEKATATAGV